MELSLSGNPKISPLYQAIQAFSDQGIPYGAGYGSRTRFFCLESRCWAVQLIPQPVQRTR